MPKKAFLLEILQVNYKTKYLITPEVVGFELAYSKARVTPVKSQQQE